MSTHLLIVNPAAGGGRGRGRADALARPLREVGEVEIVETAERGDAIRIAAERGGGVDRVVAVGGDGTLNEVLSGLMKVRASGDSIADLGFLPSGTANAAARAFGFSVDPEVAAEGLRDGRVRTVDVGMVRHAKGERPFLVRFGAGLDAAVINALNASRTGVMGMFGLIRHAPRVFGTMRRYPAPDIRVEVDGVSFGTAASVVLPNVDEVGLRATIAEGAAPDDGLLDVLAVSLPSKLSIVTLGVRMLASSLQSAPEVRHTLGERVRLTADDEVPFQVDGEPVGVLPVEVWLEREAIRLLLS